MTASTRLLDQIIVYNPTENTAVWLTPAEAHRVISARPFLELIQEGDVDYKYMLELAGPRPQRFVTDP